MSKPHTAGNIEEEVVENWSKLEEEDVVLSDVHLEVSTIDSTYSRFVIEGFPDNEHTESATEGRRRNRKRPRPTAIGLNIKHELQTEIARVGLQVWRAALLLADFIIHRSEWFKGCVVMELGGGTGITSLTAALVAETVFLTDYAIEVLGE